MVHSGNASWVVEAVLVLYAYLRHAFYGGALIPTTVAALLSRGIPGNVYLRHTDALIGRGVAALSLALTCGVRGWCDAARGGVG